MSRAVFLASRKGNADTFASQGQVRSILFEANRALARILLVAYRDFLSARHALWRYTSSQIDATSVLDPLRGAPIASYSLRALAGIAAGFGFRADVHFRTDIEALWDVVQGHEGSHASAAVQAQRQNALQRMPWHAGGQMCIPCGMGPTILWRKSYSAVGFIVAVS
eukprot:IDg18317t1